MRVLIVKVSSLGDIIHTLPAVTDAYRAKNGLRFDWVVEEAFAEIPAWHPAVDKVIPVAFRRWKKDIFEAKRSGEFARFKKDLQETHYDLVLDAQGLIKSAFISRLAKGLTVGLSDHAIKEPLATLFYNVVYTVPWQQHAVERVRELFSRTFNYALENKSCDYGINNSFTMPGKEQGREKSLLFLHGTTWNTKKWPDQYWQQLVHIAEENGYKVNLLWGNAEEYERVSKIAASANNVEIYGGQSLNDIAKILVKTQGVVAVDTGLAHLAAALQLPLVSVYGATDPDKTGTYARSQVHLRPTLDCAPCLKKKCEYKEAISDNTTDGAFPACFRNNTPEAIWIELSKLMDGGQGSLDKIFSVS